MPNDFRFKQFLVRQQRAAMRVNTDGVLLGAWVSVDGLTANDRVLDIGTGTGVITLMTAQRTASQVDAVEIDAPSADEARANFENSVWHSRLNLYCTDIQRFTPEYHYKLILSNPPYFVNSLAAPTPARNTARHANDLTYNELVDAAARLLTPNGRLAVILPAGDETTLFRAIAREKTLYLHRLTEVLSLPDQSPKRTLMEFGFDAENKPGTDKLLIQDTNSYTTEYKQLTSEFYINF